MELGITSAKGKDGLAALTRERKQKQLSISELRELWGKRVSSDERMAIQNEVRIMVSDSTRVTEMKAMDFAVRHCYERASLVTDKELLRQALRYGVGDVKGHQWFTTNKVLAEERRLIDFVQTGRGNFKPFTAAAYQFQNQVLSEEQREAVLHVLHSTV